MSTVKVFATSGSDLIAKDICAALINNRLPRELQPEGGLTLGKLKAKMFSNENIEVELGESVRGCFVVLIHSQVPPVNQNLIEMFACINAIRGAHSEDILLVFPYMPYSRSDRKNKPRISVMAKWLAKNVNHNGVKKVLLLDPHDTHIKHYFDPDADEISATYLLAHDMRQNISDNFARDEYCLVFADLGAANRFSPLPKLLDLNDEWAIINKYRDDDTEETHIRGIIGKVKEKHCVLFDDESLTGGTIAKDCAYLLDNGALSVTAYAIHAPLHSQKTSDEELLVNMESSLVRQFSFADSIPVKHKITKKNSKIRIVSLAPLLAEAISRIVQNQSLTALHNPDCVNLYLK
jgi:ribose-phosphate pyrophosphokinase